MSDSSVYFIYYITDIENLLLQGICPDIVSIIYVWRFMNVYSEAYNLRLQVFAGLSKFFTLSPRCTISGMREIRSLDCKHIFWNCMLFHWIFHRKLCYSNYCFAYANDWCICGQNDCQWQLGKLSSCNNYCLKKINKGFVHVFIFIKLLNRWKYAANWKLYIHVYVESTALQQSF